MGGDSQSNTHSNTRGDATAASGSLRRWLSRLVIALGIAWVVVIFARDLPALRDSVRIASPGWLAYSLLAGTAALLCTVPVFQMILRYYGGTRVSYVYSARLMFVAQILRHLPGRVWGIVYLVEETRARIPPAAMIRANLDVMVFSLGFTLLIAGTLTLGVFAGIAAGVLFAIAGLTVATLAIRWDLIGTVARAAVALAPRLAQKYGDALRPQHVMTWSASLQMIAFYIVVWCLYLSVWWAFPLIFPALADTNIWLLCAAYSAAWVIGYLAMITPGGLGIREAGFIALSAQLTSLPTLTFLALFIRLWQVAVELLVFAAFAFVKPDEAIGAVGAGKEPV